MYKPHDDLVHVPISISVSALLIISTWKVLTEAGKKTRIEWKQYQQQYAYLPTYPYNQTDRQRNSR